MNAAYNSDWIDVPQNVINKPERIEKNGIEFRFMISPSDIPAAIRVQQESSDQPKKLIIEFKYLTSHEETKVVALQDFLQAEIGKVSSKIYKIFIDVDVLRKSQDALKIKADTIVPSLSSFVEKFGHQGSVKSGNADAVSRVMNIKSHLIHA